MVVAVSKGTQVVPNFSRNGEAIRETSSGLPVYTGTQSPSNPLILLNMCLIYRGFPCRNGSWVERGDRWDPKGGPARSPRKTPQLLPRWRPAPLSSAFEARGAGVGQKGARVSLWDPNFPALRPRNTRNLLISLA